MSSGRYTAARGNLSLLQDLMKREPEAYAAEFSEQYLHYEQSLNLFRLAPQDADPQHLMDLVAFIANVSHHFKTASKGFTGDLVALLKSQGAQLDSDLRLSLVKALILLRNRGVFPAPDFYALVFEDLLKCRDRSLRKFLASSILAHLKSIAGGGRRRDGKLSKQLEGYVISRLSDAAPIVVRSALLVLIQAYRKGYWKDARLANVIAQAALHPSAKIRVTALKFLLGMRKDGREEDGSDSESSDSDEEAGKAETSKTVKEVMAGYKAGKKTKKRKKAAEKAKAAVTKESKRAKVTAAGVCSMALIQDLYDPESFAESLFKSLSKGKGAERFEVRLLVMGLLAKVVGVHKLLLLHLYSYLQKYCQPHQREVTKILLYAAQATHERVPPTIVAELIRAIADAFVTERNAPEVMTVGLNAIREILANAPLAADEDLLRDLTEYKRYRNKNVSVAARGLIGLFREINPKLLHRKDRGKPSQERMNRGPLPIYGENRPEVAVPGAEALLKPDKEGGEEMGEEDLDESEDGDSLDGLEFDENDESEDADSSEDEMDEMEGEEGEMKAGEGEEDGKDGGKEEASSAAKEEAVKISSERILGDEDFRRIAIHRLRQKLQPGRVEGRMSKRERKRKRAAGMEGDKGDAIEREEEETEIYIDDDDLDEAAEEANRTRLTRHADITHMHKRPRMDKAARMESVAEGREGRAKFGGGGKRKGKPHAGRTNRTNAKGKAFSMVRQKQAKRNRNRSFRQRQQSLKNYLTKQRKMR